MVHPLDIVDGAGCEIACDGTICEHLHGIKKTVCVVGCIVGCAIIPADNPSTNLNFRRIHKCAMENCASLG